MTEKPPRLVPRDRIDGLLDYLEAGGDVVPITPKELLLLLKEVVRRRDSAKKANGKTWSMRKRR